MSLIIKDETANAVVLTIDNLGNMTFGDGTPINLLTIAGYGIIDDNGFIIHGLQSCSVNAPSGVVNVGFGETATITTIAGRIPTVALDTQYPALSYTLGEIGQLLSDPILGQFAISNKNQATEDAQRDVNNATILAVGPCGYRWI